jgi:hydrogenase/urease accessory protein HupE
MSDAKIVFLISVFTFGICSYLKYENILETIGFVFCYLFAFLIISSLVNISDPEKIFLLSVLIFGIFWYIKSRNSLETIAGIAIYFSIFFIISVLVDPILNQKRNRE